METLLANYGSEEEEEQHPASPKSSSVKFPIFTSLPPPKFSSSVVHAEQGSRLPSLAAISNDTDQKRPSFFPSIPPSKHASEAHTLSSHSQDGVDRRARGMASSFFSNSDDKLGQGELKEEGDSLIHPHVDPKKKKQELFSSLPPPKSHSQHSSSMFGNLPSPKKRTVSAEASRRVEFGPPLHIFPPELADGVDDRKKKQRTHSSYVSSQDMGALGLVDILPPPKNMVLGGGATLGGGGGGGGGGPFASAGRRLALEDDLPRKEKQNSPMPPQTIVEFDQSSISNSSSLSFQENLNTESGQLLQNYADVGFMGQETETIQYPAVFQDVDTSTQLQNQGFQPQNQEFYYPNPDIDTDLQMPNSLASIMKSQKRRGKEADVPTFIEIKQEDLRSKKIREDQLKLTGIAFGPTYKPVSSGKDKPSKLHRRKHQIGSLYYDMKQKEMELLERRAKGQLTKAETQRKYGW